MENQKDLFADDLRLAELWRQALIENEVADFQRRIESVLTQDELKSLAWSISKIPLRELAEHGNKVISILQYNLR